MKLRFTALLFLVLLTQAAISQTSSIDYTVLDGCNSAFKQDINVNLYKIIAADTILVGTKNSAIGSFTNLEPSELYILRLSSNDNSLTKISVRDAYVLSQMILGIEKMNFASIIAGNVISSIGLSTYDLVLITRDLLKISSLNLHNWFFIDEEDKMNTSTTAKINEKWFYGLPLGKTSVTFLGFQYGAIASTIPKYCTSCQNSDLQSAKILIPNDNVVQGKPVNFTIKVTGSSTIHAALFSLNYSDLSISSITGGSNTNYNHVDSIAAIHVFTNGVIPYPNNIGSTITISAIPFRNGSINSFFTLNQQFDNHFVYEQTDGCTNLLHNISIDTTSACIINWPPNITINDCENIVNTGYPESSCNYISFNYSDFKFGCSKIVRKWTANNWVTGELTEYYQNIIIDETQKLICSGVTVVIQDSAVIHAIDLVKYDEASHIYSFTQTPPYQPTKTLYPVVPKTEMLTVFDITDSTYCNVMVTKQFTNCDEVLHVFDSLSIVNDGNNYKLNATMFDGGNQNHCLGNVVDFEFLHPVTSQWTTAAIFPFEAYKNKTVSLSLRYFQENVWKTYGTVYVTFVEDSVLPPFELSCYNDPLTKNTPIEISIFSPTFENIYAIQGALRLQDAILVDTRKVALSDIQFNEELRSLRFLWVFNTQQVTLHEDDTLFTMTIVPTKDGRVSEFLSLADDLLESEAIINDFDQTKINLVFNFVQRPVGTDDDAQVAKVNVFPNPTYNGRCTIEMEGNLSLDIYNLDGTRLHNVQIQTIDNTHAELQLPENTTNTLYLLHAHGNNSSLWKKILVRK